MKFFNVKDASTEELRELQYKELEILKKFKKIADQNNISFFISGGTLIGAARSGGFIPWDDDIDVMMWRSDYERLYSLRNDIFKDTSLVLNRTDKKINQHLTGMTLKDSKTVFINHHSLYEKGLTQSIGFDIMPLDYRPVGKFKSYLQVFWGAMFSLYNANRLPDHQGRFVRAVATVPLKIVPDNLKFRLWKFAEKRMIQLGNPLSDEAVELGVGIKALKRHIKSKWFSRTKLMKFEDVEMPVPVGYKEYLNAVVGDYMKMPPKETRIPKHNTVLVDTKVSYSDKLRLNLIAEMESDNG